jgi:hypothetical protein
MHTPTIVPAAMVRAKGLSRTQFLVFASFITPLAIQNNLRVNKYNSPHLKIIPCCPVSFRFKKPSNNNGTNKITFEQIWNHGKL